MEFRRATVLRQYASLTQRKKRCTSKIYIAPLGFGRRHSDYAPSSPGRKLSQGSIRQEDEDTVQVFSNTSSGLERLPTFNLTRNVVLGIFFTSPVLFKIGFGILKRIANSRATIFNPDSNPFLKAVIKPLVYDQFCAGTNRSEIFKTRDAIKKLGFSGVVLCYAKEMQVASSKSLVSENSGIKNRNLEISQWAEGTLRTLDMVGEGDWLGIKFTGAGPAVTNALLQDTSAPTHFIDAMDAICRKAQSKACKIWIDAEQQALQSAIDRWTIDLMRQWNKGGNALIYNTIQAYLKTSRTKLKDQLAAADREGWTLGVKLVRGAYIANDQRHKIHDTKADTDDSYNSIVRDLLSGENLGFATERFPKMQLFLAGHNPESVAQAWDLMQFLWKSGELKVVPDFGQLQGMADELGCRFLQRCEGLVGERTAGDRQKLSVVPRIYKCLTWGSIQECMQYLLRRLIENQGGADRMRNEVAANWAELKRRMLRRT